MSIDTREELIDALSEAAELEHGLLIEYLFAAFSLKRGLDEGLTPLDQAQIVAWEQVILDIAREEMGHLGLVCNLLASIGGAPRFGRPNFPQPDMKYYPFDLQLERFNDSSLFRFVCAELPQGEPPPSPPSSGQMALHALAVGPPVPVVPDPLKFQYIGELYGKIAHGFSTIPEAELFIGPRFTQDRDNWSVDLQLQLVTDRVSALKAIRDIVIDGEGAPENREDSHYQKFVRVRAELKQRPEFEPARLVVRNPATRPHRDSGGRVTLITNETALRVAELFNAVYNTALLMLIQYYSYGGESASQRVGLRGVIGQVMSGLLRPLAEVLTELPAGDPERPERAGPGFEIYSDLRIAPYPANRWTILLERLSTETKEAESLEAVHPRLRLIADHLRWTNMNVARFASEEG